MVKSNFVSPNIATGLDQNSIVSDSPVLTRSTHEASEHVCVSANESSVVSLQSWLVCSVNQIEMIPGSARAELAIVTFLCMPS